MEKTVSAIKSWAPAGPQQKVLLECVLMMLVPIARFCVRHSIRLQDLVELCKIALIRVAEENARHLNEKSSARCVSMMTGVHRKDITRLTDEQLEPKEQKTALVRVVGLWQTDSRFTTKSGDARTLEFGSAESEFSRLVNSVSSDLKPGSVRTELERLGMVQYTKRGIKLVTSTFIPKGEMGESFRLLATDASDLITAVEENVREANDTPNFHIRTEYDNIVKEAVPRIREWIFDEASSFHRRAMKFISRYDRDVNEKLTGKEGGIRISLCGFSLVEEKGESSSA